MILSLQSLLKNLIASFGCAGEKITLLILMITLFSSNYLLIAQEAPQERNIPEWIITQYEADTGITWYKPPPENSEYTNFFSVFVGLHTGLKPWLVLRIAYNYSWNRDILLIYKYTVKVGGITYQVKTSFNSVNRTSNYVQKTFSEWYDNYVYPELYEMIEAIINAEQAVISFHGINGYAERVIDKAEIEKLQEMLDVYEILGGDYQF